MRFAALAVLVAGFLAGAEGASAQSLESGRKTFEQRCALCHGGDGEGGEKGPAIDVRLPALSDADLTTLIHDGRPLKGMPGRLVPEAEMAGLPKFLPPLPRGAPKVGAKGFRLADCREPP